MKKELLLCGMLACCGAFANAAFGSNESDIENAVADALKAAAAKAEQVTFSASDRTLLIKGIEYAMPMDAPLYKGSIQEIRLEGVDENAFLVSTAESGDLPRVAEKAVFSGWSSTSVQDGVNIRMDMASYAVQGWYQRLGQLAGIFSKDGMGQSLFEELVRYRMDSFRADNIKINITEAPAADAQAAKGPNSQTSTIAIASMESPNGVPGPGQDDQIRMTDVLLRNLEFFSGDTTGKVDSLAINGIAVPSPAQMSTLWKAVSEAGASGNPEGILKALSELYAKQFPLSQIRLENMQATAEKEGDPFTLDSLTLRMDRPEGSTGRLDLDINALRLPASILGELNESLLRSAPQGLVLDMRLRGNSAESGSNAGIYVSARGLGAVEINCMIKGDAVALAEQIGSKADDEDALMALLSDNVQKANISYEDSGLLPLAANLALESGDAIGMEKLSMLFNYSSGNRLNWDFAMNGLHVGLDLTGPYKDVIEHFAPSGLAVDLLSNAEITRDDCNTNLDAAVRGLGRQNLKIALQGDLLTIAKQAAGTEDEEDITKLLSQVKISDLRYAYKDSGLAAMLLGIAAKELEMQPQQVIEMAKGMLQGLESSDDALLKKVGAMLTEQLAKPGEMHAHLSAGANPDILSFAGDAASNPGALPLELSSTPGPKGIEEYLK